MNLMEIVLITVGVSLNVFVVAECQGAVVARLEKMQLAATGIWMAVWQTSALLLGSFFVTLLNRFDTHLSKEAFIGKILAILIFLGMGIRMFLKAWRNEKIIEKRQDEVNFKKIFFMPMRGTILTILTGIAFGFLETDLQMILLIIACVTVLAVLFGTYTGYRFGFEQKTKVYAVGGVLLFVAGIDVIVRYLVLRH